MKTQYFHVISNKDGLLVAKGREHAMAVIDPSKLRLGKGYMSLKDVQSSRKPFHIGIVKVADAGVTFLS